MAQGISYSLIKIHFGIPWLIAYKLDICYKGRGMIRVLFEMSNLNIKKKFQMINS